MRPGRPGCAGSSTWAGCSRRAGRVSPHLASRKEVGDLLLASGVPTAVLQAGIVVGAGSASFEMIRHLAVAGPVLPMPDRAWNAVQPIAVDDVLHHLMACLEPAAGASAGRSTSAGRTC